MRVALIAFCFIPFIGWRDPLTRALECRSLDGTRVETARPPSHAQVIDPNNIPDEIRSCVRSQPALELDGGTNPFYISGDYDGDGVIDFAVLVRDHRDRGPGIHHILFCFAHIKAVLWSSDELAHAEASPFTAWFLVRRQSRLLSVHPQIKHDALAVMMGDEGGGLVYWDGAKLRWQQEE